MLQMTWICAVLALTPAVWPAEPQAAPVHQRPAAPATAPSRSDRDLEAAIKAKFVKSKSSSTFSVKVQSGVATIDGKTDVVQHKGVATRMAKTAGAVAVVNRVQVSDAAKQKAAGNLELGRRRAQVQRGDVRSERK